MEPPTGGRDGARAESRERVLHCLLRQSDTPLFLESLHGSLEGPCMVGDALWVCGRTVGSAEPPATPAPPYVAAAPGAPVGRRPWSCMVEDASWVCGRMVGSAETQATPAPPYAAAAPDAPVGRRPWPTPEGAAVG